METLEQMRSKAAWAAANERSSKLQNFDSYKNMSKGAPAMIINCGLIATFAFYQSRKQNSDESQALVTDLIHWLATRKILDQIVVPSTPKAGNTPQSPFNIAMTRLVHSNSQTYQQATVETLAYLRWLRQFADAVQVSDGR
jgi:CRISPR-associated protein Cmr5